jgi:AcrR family transcriptional regulator
MTPSRHFVRTPGETGVPRESSDDPRVRRTRRSLQEALLALAADQDFAAITVRAITRQAGINRATFYQHYRDKADLIAQTLDSLFDELTAEGRAFVAAHLPLTPDVVPPPLISLFQHVGERPALYCRLLRDGTSPFASRLRVFHEEQFKRVWPDMRTVIGAGDAPVEVRAGFAAAATHGLIGWWLEHGRRERPEAMARWLWELLASVLWGRESGSGEKRKPSAARLS